MEGNPPPVIVRDATRADVEALSHLRPPRGLHSDRIPEPANADKRYVLAEVDGKPAGFGVVYFQGDPMWERPEQVPLVMDVWVDPTLRRRGIGRKIIDSLEQSARQRGFSCIYLQVQPEKNPQAANLYKELGYQPLTARPYRDFFHSVDEEGNVHEGTEMIIDMRKWL
jgi:ribosomal protein S18 acetylase RimI-like enzyme